MTRRWKWASVIVVVVFAIGILAVWPIRPAPKPPTVEVRVSKIQDDETAFHWKWTFTSERHWATFRTTDENGEHIIVLEPAGTYAGPVERLLLAARSRRPRTLTYEVDARREPQPTAPGLTGYTVSILMRAENGGAPSSSLSSSSQIPDGEWALRFKALRTADGRLDLPARVPLAVVAGTTQVLEFP